MQGPAAGHVQRLQAAADPQHGHPERVGRARERELGAVDDAVGRAEPVVAAARAVGERVEVRPAREAQAVEPLEQDLRQLGVVRRQHHGQSPAGLDRTQIRHAEPELLGGSGLVAALQGPELTQVALRREYADQRPHGVNHRQIARFGTWTDGQSRRLPSSPHVEPIHLFDVPAEPDASSRQAGPQGHLAVVLPRRQDRRPRPQRLRQVDAAADHGRSGHRVPRRGPARARRHRRAARAGAAARRRQGRARQRRGRRGRDPRAARPLQRARRELLGRDRGRVRAPAGGDRRRRRVEPRHPARPGDGRAPAPARRRRRHDALRRRAPPRRALPAAALRPRPAAARRADEPPRRRVGRLARAAPRGLQGHDRRRHPRSLLPRQRRGLDPRARPRQRAPVQGQLLELARAEAGAARAGGAPGVLAPADDRGRARVGAPEPEGPAQEVEGAPEQLRAAARRGAQRQARLGPDPHPAGPAPRRQGDRGVGAAQGLRRPAADRGPLVLAPARRHRRASSAPTARARRRCSG